MCLTSTKGLFMKKIIKVGQVRPTEDLQKRRRRMRSLWFKIYHKGVLLWSFILDLIYSPNRGQFKDTNF